MKRFYLIFIAACCFFSCSHTIQYSRKGIPTAPASLTQKVKITILPFDDYRREYSAFRQWLFGDSIPKKNMCYNSEKGYGDVSIPATISRSIIGHLEAKNAFAEVYYDSIEGVDFGIHAKIRSFVGKTALPNKQTAATSQTTLFNYEIEYFDITIFTNTNDTIAQIPRIISKSEVKVPYFRKCSQLYELVNQHLRSHNDMFCDSVISRINLYLGS